MLDVKLIDLRLSTSFHQRDRMAALERLLHSPYFSRNKLQMAFWKHVSVSTCSCSLKIFGLRIHLSSYNILFLFFYCGVRHWSLLHVHKVHRPIGIHSYFPKMVQVRSWRPVGVVEGKAACLLQRVSARLLHKVAFTGVGL